MTVGRQGERLICQAGKWCLCCERLICQAGKWCVLCEVDLSGWYMVCVL